MAVKEETNLTKDNTNNLYNAADLFMLRTPVLPLSTYLELVSDNDLNPEQNYYAWFLKLKKMIMDNSTAREALLVSSPSLYNSLISFEDVNNKKKLRHLVNGLAKYMIRMSTRSTPFGLCSSVSVGSFEDTAKLPPVKSEDYYKRARPDMEWLLKIISEIEMKDDVIDSLEVCSNQAISRNGTRLKIPFSTHIDKSLKDGGSFTNQPTIQGSEVVDKVLEMAKEHIKVENLLNFLKEEYPDVELSTIRGFLKELIRQEFLISNLRPILMDPHPFKLLLNNLERIDVSQQITTKLNDIYRRITQYNNSSIGSGEIELNNIEKEMKKITVTKNVLQVDLMRKAPHLSLNENVKKDIEKVAEILWKMSPPRTRLKHIEHYYNDFIEKYGIYQEVPLLTLLDATNGLGYPATYTHPNSNRLLLDNSSQISQGKTNKLTELLTETLLKNELEISLTEEDCKKIIESYGENSMIPMEKAADSMELYFQLMSESAEKINKGDYKLVVGANPGSHSAANTFGRFIDLFGKDTEERIKEIRWKEQNLKQNAVMAELVYQPPSGRSANLVMSKNYRDYEIPIGTNSSKSKEFTILLSDLVVGATYDSLYLKSKRLNKMVLPVTSHMYSEFSAPNICRFLLEISTEGIKPWTPFNWVPIDGSPILPRVSFKNIILFPAEWRLNRYIFGKSKLNSKDFYNEISIWRDKWKVPRYVYLTNMDNRILLDLEDEMHLEILLHDFNRLKGEKSLKLVETCMPSSNNSSLNMKEIGPYITEFVFPLVKNEEYINSSYKNKQIIQRKSNNQFIKNEERLKMLGSDWIYLKLYGVNPRLEEFLKVGFLDILYKGKKEGWIKHGFFMRYRDPEDHIRLRLHGKSENLIKYGIENIYHWATKLQKEGIISHIEFGTYDPEVERYGGPDLISTAEELFSIDSEMVAQFLSLKRFNNYGVSEEIFGVVSVVNILSSFFPEFKDQLDWLNRSVDYKKFKEEYKEFKDIYSLYTNNEDDWRALRSDESGSIIYNLLEIRKDTLNKYATKVHEFNKLGTLYNSLDDIIGSIIHLHLNRLIGLDREKEEMIITIARHSLYNLRYIKERVLIK
ncbi:lantibiotic dehydratase [Priestia megaterium]|uniref:lantibiotic dehydratase n=1 Tax=Priestia megaterium TaxID=1404 RepID=UPI00234E8BCB|nr:lantibiotic dehydratase [Priestia megaterium]MDC7783999.1 lantibiotic dehydratase [Priestia megaterium]